MRDDVTGDPEQVLTFVKRCAEAFALTGRWGFEWANTCSRPRINAFGGGAHVVDLADGSTIAWTDTNGWLALTLANGPEDGRTEEHKSELQSLMRNSYAVFCLN